ARRGETVTWILTVDILPGWHTYPTKQRDPKAESYTSKIKAPSGNDLIPVGALIEPSDPVKSAEPDLGVKELFTYEGTAVWKQEMVVNPTASPGKKEIKVPVTILACAQSCVSENRAPVATLTITDAPAIENPKITHAAPIGADPANSTV